MRVSPLVTVPLLAGSLLAGSVGRVEAHPPLPEKEALIDQALEENPLDPELHLQRAALYRKRGSWDAAAATYLRAAELGADPDRIDVTLAQVFLKTGLPMTAERQVERVLARRPEDPGALVTRGRARRALGKLEAAASDLCRGVGRLERPDPNVVLEAMDAQVAAGLREEALRIADEAMSKIGTVAPVQLPAVDLELGLGRHDAALRRIDELLVQAPRHELWLARRAEILEKAGRTDEARATYRHALSLIGERPARRRNEKIRTLEQQLRGKLAQRDGNETENP